MTKNDIVDIADYFEGPPASGGGGGDDMLEQRVVGLERRMDRMESNLDDISKTVHEISGKLSNMPTTWTIITTIITSFVAVMGTTAVLISRLAA